MTKKSIENMPKRRNEWTGHEGWWLGLVIAGSVEEKNHTT